MVCPILNPGTSARLSAMVLPVTVMQSPCSIPFSSINFNTAGVPPCACKSSITYFPLGLKSASIGVISPNRIKSSRESSTLAAFAIAIRCITALVEPPRMITRRIAFSNDFFVRMSLGLISFSSNCLTAAAASTISSFFSLLLAGFEEVYGKLIPSASSAAAMVLAVYIPPHAPAPGMACSIICSYSSSEMVPAVFCPSASNAETTSSFLPL